MTPDYKARVLRLEASLPGTADQRFAYFEKLAHGGRFGEALLVECAVHTSVLSLVTSGCLREMRHWHADPLPAGVKSSLRTQRVQIDQLAWTLAVKSLEHCVSTLQLDNTDALIELARSIVKSAAKISGVEALKQLVEIIAALSEIKELSHIRSHKLEAASSILLEVDLYISMTIVAMQWALDQVEALVRHPVDFSSMFATLPVMPPGPRAKVDQLIMAQRREVAANQWLPDSLAFRTLQGGLWGDLQIGFAVAEPKPTSGAEGHITQK